MTSATKKNKTSKSTKASTTPKFAKKILQMALEPIILPSTIFASGTYLYPCQGFYYFIRSPILWAYLMSVMIPLFILTLVVYLAMYTMLYPLQAVIAVFFNGPTGLITAWFALLHQSAVMSNMMATWFLFPTPLKMLFDAVMTKEGFDDLVVKGRARRVVVPSLLMRTKIYLRTIPRNIFFSFWAIKLFLTFLLHFVPVVGPIILVFIAAPKRGRAVHGRYFELKGWSDHQISRFMDGRRGQYTGFGLVSGAFEAIPLFGLLFVFSNTCGGALWAANLERAEQKIFRGSFRYVGAQKIRRLVKGKADDFISL